MPTSGSGDFMLVLQDLVAAGAKVKKAEMVAEFDRQNMLLRLDDYRASVVQAEASLRKLEAELDVDKKAHEHSIKVARAELDKARLDLQTIPVRSAIDTEKLRLAAEEADARYKQLLNEVKFKETSLAAQARMSEIDFQQAKIELQRAEANAERMVLRSPMGGVAVMQSVWRGGEFGQVQQGDMLYPGQMFMQVVDPSSMIINAAINQADVQTLRVGARAKVRFDAYPELELPAHVFAIGAMPKASAGFRGSSSGVKEVPVRLKLDRMDPRVIPDLSVSADVVIADEQHATVAPLEAVFQEAGKSFVFVQRPDGWERREVELGLTNNIAVAVRSGLPPGEVLATGQPPANPMRGAAGNKGS